MFFRHRENLKIRQFNKIINPILNQDDYERTELKNKKTVVYDKKKKEGRRTKLNSKSTKK